MIVYGVDKYRTVSSYVQVSGGQTYTFINNHRREKSRLIKVYVVSRKDYQERSLMLYRFCFWNIDKWWTDDSAVSSILFVSNFAHTHHWMELSPSNQFHLADWLIHSRAARSGFVNSCVHSGYFVFRGRFIEMWIQIKKEDFCIDHFFVCLPPLSNKCTFLSTFGGFFSGVCSEVKRVLKMGGL